MSQYLPFVGFKWLTQDKVDRLGVNIIRKDNPEGFILEVDLKYPKE